MIYLKKVINQDLVRTPTFNLEAINYFFKIDLKHGDTTTKTIKLNNGQSFEVEFKRRETRNEYRVFLNELFKEINPIEEDILIFKPQGNNYLCEHIPKTHNSYIHYDHLFISRQNHEVIIDDNGTEPSDSSKQQFIKSTFDIDTFINDLSNSNLIYSPQLIHRFIASLLTKPFLILTGLSGSGKTKLAQAFVQWISENKDQYKIIPVGADWTNREPLLGYPNALNTEEYILPENGALELIIKASKEENKDKPYFLILDEMNLSHVERYFADFLSTMESKESIPLHPSEKKDLTAANSDVKVPWEIKLPENLFIIGTVNIDETTHMFSPKVLDRANTIEFRISTTDLEKYFARGYKEIKDLNNEGRGMGQNFVEIARGSSEEEQENKNKRKLGQEIEKKIADELKKIFGELSKIGAEFGYRTASEILKLCSNLEKLQYENILAKESGIEYKEMTDYMIDIAIMQKLLPKVHGSRRQLTGTLIKIAELCYKEGEDLSKLESKLSNIEFDVEKENCKYPLSLEKIARMYRAAINNGFASFAEA